uniref:Uncharacterized protein n=1 Tax=Aegilops tauschii subsp. strangulata TaxID=200361 RepID=A0A453IJ52_AEGTS
MRLMILQRGTPRNLSPCFKVLVLISAPLISMQIVFNPVTVSSIKKILLRICKQESSGTTEELVHQIATSCGGDIRHAIMSLQYYCLNPRRLDSALAISASLSELKGHATLAPAQDCYGLGSVIHSPCGRDETLTLFHALGKFLHNKRETHGDV